jgi:hypothetical protein
MDSLSFVEDKKPDGTVVRTYTIDPMAERGTDAETDFHQLLEELKDVGGFPSDEGSALALFIDGETHVKVALKDGEAVAVQVGSTKYPADTSAFSGGSRKLRLKKKTRRSKRHTRGGKSRKLRKLTSRRR